MLNKRLLPMLLVCLMLFVAGCSSNTTSTVDNKQKAGTSIADSKNSTEQSVLPNNAPDMTGKVKTIEGNKLTVYKVNMNNENRPPERQNNNMPPDENLKPQEQTGNSSNEPPKPREDMFQVTDETCDLVIAADVNIVKGFGRNKNIDETTQLNIEDIKTGDILGLWFGEKLSDGGQSVNYVQIMQANRIQ